MDVVSKERQVRIHYRSRKVCIYMKGKKLTEWFANKKLVSSCVAIALAAVIGGVSFFSGAGEAPEFPSYTDPVMETSIAEEETPLASQPKTTVKTTSKTKTTKKTVKLKKASKKSYTKKLKTAVHLSGNRSYIGFVFALVLICS